MEPIDQATLLEGVFERIRTHFACNGYREEKVREWLTPEQISESLDIAVKDDAIDADELLKLVDQYISMSVNTQHPNFLQPLWGGLSAAGLVGEIVTVLTNTSVYTWELAPVATLVEQEMVATLGAMAGWESVEGTFTTGGSNANMLAMILARDQAFPNAITSGINGSELAVFVSEDSHYSLLMSAHVLGIGSEGVIKIETDIDGRMKPSALQQAITECRKTSRTPVCVIATSGTTVRGAFDPLEEISSICKSENIWLHVDAALGGACLFSSKHSHLMKGVERADSLTWDPHKVMGVPITCSTLLTPHAGALMNTCSYVESAHYLFHEPGIEYDLGRTSLQCGRRVDALKLWISWKAEGNTGWKKQIEHYLELAEYLEDEVNKDSMLELMSSRTFTNVCLRYRPQNLDVTELNNLNEAIRQKMIFDGNFMTSLTQIKGQTILRPVICNSAVDKKSIDDFLSEIHRIAKDV
ncbi:MAG: aminotransferase class V-fold PLP-dependent enzyme [Candidatus Thalassarchaeaceae archaeon]|jgi:glutamate/tyrosine decarboxylase-like PLP-dependent enzyme|nr:aminotransferase class V-fold PLP-dependent enzyme [Candidatus Thalassarchaeaceae archaeon]